MNEHQRDLVSTAERYQYTPCFKFKSTDVNLLSGLVWLLDQMQRYDWSDGLSIKLPVKGQLETVGLVLVFAVLCGAAEM